MAETTEQNTQADSQVEQLEEEISRSFRDNNRRSVFVFASYVLFIILAAGFLLISANSNRKMLDALESTKKNLQALESGLKDLERDVIANNDSLNALGEYRSEYPASLEAVQTVLDANTRRSSNQSITPLQQKLLDEAVRSSPTEIPPGSDGVQEYDLNSIMTEFIRAANLLDTRNKNEAAVNDFSTAVVHFSAVIDLLESNGVVLESDSIQSRIYLDALRSRGIAFSELGQHDDALKDFEHAITLSPDSPLSLIYISDYYSQFSSETGDSYSNLAVDYARKAVEISETKSNDSIANAYNALGFAHLSKGDFAIAITNFEVGALNATTATQRAAIRENIALIYLAEQKWPETFDLSEELKGTSAEQSWIWCFRAIAARKMDKDSEYSKSWSKCQEQTTENSKRSLRRHLDKELVAEFGI